MRLAKRVRWLVIAALAVFVLALGGKAGVRWWGIQSMTRPAAGTRLICTMTELPRLPRVPWRYVFRDPSEQEKERQQSLNGMEMAGYNFLQKSVE